MIVCGLLMDEHKTESGRLREERGERREERGVREKRDIYARLICLWSVTRYVGRYPSRSISLESSLLPTDLHRNSIPHPPKTGQKISDPPLRNRPGTKKLQFLPNRPKIHSGNAEALGYMYQESAYIFSCDSMLGLLSEAWFNFFW